jgi:hypothetical protein
MPPASLNVPPPEFMGKNNSPRSRDTRTLEADLCVVGGGLAGVCAALAAARNGARVVLVQDRSVLGGNASSEIKMHVVGADCHGSRPGARESGIIEELKLEDAVRNPLRTYALWDLLLYEKVKENGNITLLLDSDCVGCETRDEGEGCSIVSVVVNRNTTEERVVVRAKYFADCSGDGRLGFEAGADFQMGREGRDRYGESLAIAEGDGQTLGNSILFTARRHDSPQPFHAPAWCRKFRKEDFKLRPIHGFEYGYWWAEWGGQFDTIKDIDEIRHELYRIALGIWDYVKNSGDYPDSANWVLDWVGAIPGKRESRRFLGPHVLVQQDVEGGRVFDDTVAYGGWWLDLHPPSGVDAVDEPPCVQHHIKYLYGIPLRCLFSRNVENLFFAGRNISASHVAFASTRVMATCAVMGQAVGTAAAVLCRRTKDAPISEACAGPVLHDIQQTLLRDDAFLPGVVRAGEDLAALAVISASDEQSGAPAANVAQGPARATKSSWGSWSDDATNCWESQSLPAALTLEWPSERRIAEIHLTFCSGFERELTLSASDHVTSKTVRGPQPETVKDYDIIVDGRTVLEVRGNYLRKRVHRMDSPLTASKLQVKITATHGYPAARLFEIRVVESA